jgi:signal recognition particle subunit SRP54
MLNKMKQAIDPRMMKQLGGSANVMNLMKEMGKMEGMEDLMTGL